MEKQQFCTPKQAMQILGTKNRSHFYLQIKKGNIPSLRIGKKIFIPLEFFNISRNSKATAQ